MKLAVIGTGISGLGAAWLLRDAHDIVVYERGSRPGGHSNTVSVDGTPVDTGFIVYNERNYPRLTTLFDLLEVPTRPSDMSFSASLDGGRIEYAGDAMFASRRSLVSVSHWRMLRDILRFNRRAQHALSHGLDDAVTLSAWLEREGLGPELVHRYLLPMAAAIWSCPTATMLDFPAASLLRFFANHGLLDLVDRPQWRTVVGGSRTYVTRITEALGDRILYNRAVTAVQRTATGVTVVDVSGERRHFDGVLFATHADDTLRLLQDADELEHDLLAPFSYQRNQAVLHSDRALMPRRRAAWSSWNYLARSSDDDTGAVSVTYWMNRLQSLPSDTDYFVSLNPLQVPDPARVHYTIEYEHPVFDTAALRAQRSLGLLQGHRNCWYSGAWFGHGFHEDGFGSALEAVLSMGVEIPAALAAARRLDAPYHDNRAPWEGHAVAAAYG